LHQVERVVTEGEEQRHAADATGPGASRHHHGLVMAEAHAVHRLAGQPAVAGAASWVAHRATGAVVPPVNRSRSAGASASSSPRRPALTYIVGRSSALASTTVGSWRRCPSGLIPPTT